MALAQLLSQPFVWGPGGKAMTLEDIQRQRALADALRSQAGDTSPVGHWTQGAARVVNALGGVLADRRANSAATANAETNKGLIANLLSGGASSQPAAPTSQTAADFGGADPGRFASSFAPNGNVLRDGIIETANAIGADPLDLATAISYETAGTFNPLKKGPTTQWGQHEGLIQFGQPQQRKFGVDLSSAESAMRSQLGADGAIAKYFQSSGFKPGMSGLDLYSTINAGAPGRYSASDANNGGAPGDVRDKWENQMGGHRQKALALMGDPAQGGGAQAALERMAIGETIPTPQAPVQLAQTQLPEMAGYATDASPQGLFPPAPTQSAPPAANGLGISPAILEALSSPVADDNTRRLAGLLLQRQFDQETQTRDRQAARDNWLFQQQYEEAAQGRDPLRKAQIQKLQREAANGDESFFGNPVAIQDKNGDISYGQIGNRGTFKPIQLGEGQTFAPPTKTIDAVTENLLMDQAGNVIARIPKNLAAAEEQKVAGKSRGETQSELSSLSSKMPGLYGVVDRLQELAKTATYTRAGKFLDAAGRELGMEPREGAVARAEYTAIVDNQILPLLRDTFGAQFTAEEGQRLARTLGDPDKSPTEKSALLRAFIEQKERDIQAMQNRLGGAARDGGKRLRFNPQTGELE